jgi:hypothetical protein
VGCTKRKPVGLPNLSKLVERRDKDREAQQRDVREQEKAAAEALVARQLERQELQARLAPASAAIIEELERLDVERTPDAAIRFTKIADLAPEAFGQEVLDFVFRLLERREAWVDEPGLLTLSKLQCDVHRLLRLAMRSLEHGTSVNIAINVMMANLPLVNPDQIAPALRSIILRATPDHSLFRHEVETDSAPLQALYKAHPSIVSTALGELLDKRDAYSISLASRALSEIAEAVPDAPLQFVRTLAAKLAHAEASIDFDEYDNPDEILGDLVQTLAHAVRAKPSEVDEQIMKHLEGARENGQARLLKVYSDVMRRSYSANREPLTPTDAHVVSLKRLLWAITDCSGDDTRLVLQSTFSGRPYEMLFTARSCISQILGTAILIDDRISAEPSPPSNDPLRHMQHETKLRTLKTLQERLLGWAAHSAADDVSSTRQYIEVLSGLPEGKAVRASFISHLDHLLTSSTTVNIALPVLYSALVGTDNLSRAAAATTIGKMKRLNLDQLPSLVFEAFTTLLFDPYIVVHSAAVSALNRFSLPESFDRRVRLALSELIRAHSHDDGRHYILVECIQLMISRYVPSDKLRDKVGPFFVALLINVRVDVLLREMRFALRNLREVKGFPDLVLKVVQSNDALEYHSDEVISLLQSLPVPGIRQIGRELSRIGTSSEENPWLSAAIVETLTRGQLWAEAEEVVTAVHSSMEDTTRMKPRRLAAELDLLAVQFESAIAQQNFELAGVTSTKWRAVNATLEQDRKVNEAKRNPFPELPTEN